MLANNILGDNALTCDSVGNCMLTDELPSYPAYRDWTVTKHGITNSGKNVVETDKFTVIGGSNKEYYTPEPERPMTTAEKIQAAVAYDIEKGLRYADNSLVCDAVGNCMLKDDL